jgi:hypothetical protein
MPRRTDSGVSVTIQRQESGVIHSQIDVANRDEYEFAKKVAEFGLINSHETYLQRATVEFLAAVRPALKAARSAPNHARSKPAVRPRSSPAPARRDQNGSGEWNDSIPAEQSSRGAAHSGKPEHSNFLRDADARDDQNDADGLPF